VWTRGETRGDGTCGSAESEARQLRARGGRGGNPFADANCDDEEAQTNRRYCKRAGNPDGEGVKCIFTPADEEAGTESSCAQASSCSEFNHPRACRRSADPNNDDNCVWTRGETRGDGTCGSAESEARQLRARGGRGGNPFADANCDDEEAQTNRRYCKRAGNPDGEGVKCIFTPADEEAGTESSCAEASSCSEFNHPRACRRSADPSNDDNCVWTRGETRGQGTCGSVTDNEALLI